MTHTSWGSPIAEGVETAVAQTTQEGREHRLFVDIVDVKRTYTDVGRLYRVQQTKAEAIRGKTWESETKTVI